MPVLVQQYRTPTATALPPTLESGQIAFNLANGWMMLGNGGAEILLDGTPLTYSGPATVLGVAAVVVPAKPAAGKGYEIFKMVGTPAGSTSIYSITDALVDAETGATTADKIVAALIKRGDITTAADLSTGDQVLVTPATPGAPIAGVDTGNYVYDGAALQMASSPAMLHTLSDVTDTNVVTVSATSIKGILVRDNNVADGAASAYKLISVLDLGSF